MSEFFQQHQGILFLLALWSLPWKGIALWKAANFKQKIWFVVLLITNTLALLDIFYIFIIARRKGKERGGTKDGLLFGKEEQ